MKKIFLVLSLSLSLFASQYNVNKEKSSINFHATKFIFIGVSGKFSNFAGTVTLDNKKLSKINGVIFVNSINSKEKRRDRHLRADDYFNVPKFPKILFDSVSIKRNLLKAIVNIKGIKKELSFKISKFSIVNDNVNFILTSTVNRQDFMLNGSMSGVINNNINVKANIFASKK